jgi:hypothetical protein
MMQATDWQQHSVRGFLEGTVKKKLGFSLTSLKPNGGVRRYRICQSHHGPAVYKSRKNVHNSR